MSLSQTERSQLLQAAVKIAENARAKYSDFRVGAAVLGDKGTYLGVNVENASYGLAICAERAALAAAVTAGEKNIRAIADCLSRCHDGRNKNAMRRLPAVDTRARPDGRSVDQRP